MKAYILKMSFEDITPLIWRRVILPADATFHRLHQTIQFVTNFQSYFDSYHSFGVEIDDYFITNNEPILDEYKRRKYAGKTVRQPTSIKVDKYIEENGEFIYNYDFGDDWRIRIKIIILGIQQYWTRRGLRRRRMSGARPDMERF